MKLRPTFAKPTSSVGTPLDGASRSMLSRSTGEDLSALRVHAGTDAARAVDRADAQAVTVGHDLYFGAGAYAPQTPAGRELVAHEVGHAIQQTRSGLGRGTNAAAEHDADSFAARVMAGRRAWPRVGAPVAPAFRPKRGAKPRVKPDGDEKSFRRGDQVTGMHITIGIGGGGSVVVTTKLGDTFSYRLKATSIPTGTYEGSPKGGGSITVTNLKGSLMLQYTGRPDPATLVFARRFTIVVAQESFGGGTGGGTGPVSGPSAPTTGPLPPNPKDDTGITITVDDPSQIAELEKLGIQVDNTTPSKQPNVKLTFEDAKQLLEALRKVKAPGKADPDSVEEAPTWLDWAKLVRENQDKISGGPGTTSKKGMTLDEVRQTLDKYKKFHPVQKGAQVDVASRIKDPAVAESWNNLKEWEQKLWEDYANAFPGVQEDSSRTDLTITPADKRRMAIKLSWKYFPEGFKEAAKELFSDPLFYVTTIASIAIYVALWLNPEPIFSKAAAAALTIALLAVFSMAEILNFARAWSDVSDESEHATTMGELEIAAEHFGTRMGGAGFRVLFMIFTYLLGKKLPTQKAGGGGGAARMMQAATAGGGTARRIVVTGGEIAVLADGTVVLLPKAAQLMMSAKTAGKGGGATTDGGNGAPAVSESLAPDELPAPTTNPNVRAPWLEGENPRRYANYKYNLARRNASRPPDKQKQPLSEREWWETYGHKKPNNPYGGDGAPDHQAKVEELQTKARADYPDQNRYEIRKNKKVRGLKQKPDAAVIDRKTNKVVKVYEAARFDDSGKLIRPDEVGKIVDYQAAGVPYEFHPVGANAPPGGVLTWEPPPKSQ